MGDQGLLWGTWLPSRKPGSSLGNLGPLEDLSVDLGSLGAFDPDDNQSINQYIFRDITIILELFMNRYDLAVIPGQS